MESNKIEQIIADLRALPYTRHKIWWKDFMIKYNCQKVCEIGVRKGINFRQMTRHNPILAVAVDSWISDGNKYRNDVGFTQEELDQQYENFKKTYADRPSVKVSRGYSFDMVKQFPDELFDFVYIDADHSFDGCYRDIIDWYPKVKKEGILCGHDYEHYVGRSRQNEKIPFGVVEAVDKFVKENNITTFFNLGSNVWGLIK